MQILPVASFPCLVYDAFTRYSEEKSTQHIIMRQCDPLAIGLVGTGLEENTPQVPGFARDDSFPLPLSGRGGERGRYPTAV